MHGRLPVVVSRERVCPLFQELVHEDFHTVSSGTVKRVVSVRAAFDWGIRAEYLLQIFWVVVPHGHSLLGLALQK